jgi:hypothetical protein
MMIPVLDPAKRATREALTSKSEKANAFADHDGKQLEQCAAALAPRLPE